MPKLTDEQRADLDYGHEQGGGPLSSTCVAALARIDELEALVAEARERRIGRGTGRRPRSSLARATASPSPRTSLPRWRSWKPPAG